MLIYCVENLAVLISPLLQLFTRRETACALSSSRTPSFVLWSKSNCKVTGPPVCYVDNSQCRGPAENKIDKTDLSHHWNCHPLLRRESSGIWHISNTDCLALLWEIWRKVIYQPLKQVFIDVRHVVTGHAFSWDDCSRTTPDWQCSVRISMVIST